MKHKYSTLFKPSVLSVLSVPSALSLLFLLLSPTLLFAQVQKGRVKTAGLPGVHGKGIPGAIITFNGKINSTISANDGGFSFIVKAKDGSYSLKSVSAKANDGEDYVIFDKDELGKSRRVESNEVTVCMFKKDELQTRKSRIDSYMSKRTQELYDRKIDSLNALLDQEKIKNAEYDREVKALQDKQNNTRDLIRILADKFATTDYDLMDSITAQINWCIENGDVEGARRLMATQGTTAELEKENKESHRLADLAAKDAKLSDATLEQRYYQEYGTYLIEGNLDSALVSLEKRAELDTTNIQYQKEVAEFINKRAGSGNYEAGAKAMRYAKRALRLTIARDGEKSLAVADCYELMMDCDRDCSKELVLDDEGYNTTIETYKNKNIRANWAKKILEIKQAFSIDSLYDYTRLAENISKQESAILWNKYLLSLPKDEWYWHSAGLVKLSDCYEGKNRLKYMNSALKLFHSHITEDSLVSNKKEFELLDNIYNRLRSYYKSNLDSINEYTFLNKKIWLEEFYAKKDTSISNVDYRNIIDLCFRLKKYEEGKFYALKELDNEEDLPDIYNKLMALYSYLGDFDNAEDCYRKGMYLMSREKTGIDYYSMEYTHGFMYYMKGDYENALKVCAMLERKNSMTSFYPVYDKNDFSLSRDINALKKMCNKKLGKNK